MMLKSMRVALIGHPNCGKTTLFNWLTGMRQKVANYAGVTVERKMGYCVTPLGHPLHILDLPGIYSLNPMSPDELITQRICFNQYPDEAAIDLLVSVVDVTNLRSHLRLVLALKQLGRPMMLVLNRMDVAKRLGIRIDIERLQQQLGGIPVIAIYGKKKGPHALLQGFDHIITHVMATPQNLMESADENPNLHSNTHQTARDITDEQPTIQTLMATAVHWPPKINSYDETIDRWILHPIWGPLTLVMLMFLVFQAVFSWAEPFKDAIETGIATLGEHMSKWLPVDSALRSLVQDGLFAGLGTIFAFLPQILFLFFFIFILETSGYLPRAAFLLDRILFKVGLTGRAFIPLLSSFACAIPSIMATRSIQDPRDRLITILIAPLMTCSARLPIYTLLIGAFIPQRVVGGIFNLQGIVLFSLYCFGVVSALTVAFVMKHFRHNQSEQMLLMELPAWRLPNIRDIALSLQGQAKLFIQRVGGIILALTLLLWCLSSFPAAPANATQAAIHYSLAGRIGHWLAVLFEPIGFNWQICVALIPGLAAREVAVSALGTVYAMSSNDDAFLTQLSALIANQWSLATALSLLVWYVFAPQCLSTLAVIRRETHSWRNVAIATLYLFGLAYAASFLVYKITSLL